MACPSQRRRRTGRLHLACGSVKAKTIGSRVGTAQWQTRRVPRRWQRRRTLPLRRRGMVAARGSRCVVCTQQGAPRRCGSGSSTGPGLEHGTGYPGGGAEAVTAQEEVGVWTARRQATRRGAAGRAEQLRVQVVDWAGAGARNWASGRRSRGCNRAGGGGRADCATAGGEARQGRRREPRGPQDEFREEGGA